jgi:hypothetical protein
LSGRAHLSGKQGVFVSEDDIQNIDCAVINFVVTEPCQLVAVGEQQGVYVRKATRFNLDVYVESTDGKMVSGIIEHSDCVDSNISLRTNSVGATTTDISLAFATTGGLLRASKRIGTDFSGLQLVGGSLAGGPTMQPFSLPGAGSDIPLQLFASGNGTVRMGNANGISLRAGSGIATQVNYALVQGAAASNGPVYTAAGTDTNIGVTLRPVGTGEARILSGDGTLMLRAANGGLLSFRGVGTVVAPTLSAALPTDGSATNVAIATAINAIRTALIDQGLCV